VAVAAGKVINKRRRSIAKGWVREGFIGGVRR
jgi:hypothetical protein